jgi:hypothetical protein
MGKLSIKPLVLVVLGILLGASLVAVQARSLQTSTQSNLLMPVGEQNNLTRLYSEVLAVTITPISVTTDSDTLTSSLEVTITSVQEVQTLIHRWESSLLATPGWYHIVSQHERADKEVGRLPNGQPIPLDYIMDGWYKVNSGLVEAGVFIMRDFEGAEVQKVVYRDGVIRNLTFGIEDLAEPSPLYLDFGFSRRLAETAKGTHQLTRAQVMLMGRTMSVFTIESKEVLGTIAGFDQPIIGSAYSAYFDSTDGSLVRVERTFIIAGEPQVIETVDLLISEAVKVLPIEIQELVQSEVRP